jgi:hypothetical protein
MTTNRTARTEAIVQITILLFMGGMAGAASFVHIHDLTVQHGQPSWIGWANAVVIELMSIVAGLDIRRRTRASQPAGYVLGVLLAAAGVSLAAQVAEAEPSIWGWTVAALPALGLLAVVKIVLSRTGTSADRDPSLVSVQPDPPDRTAATGRTADQRHPAAIPVRTEHPRARHSPPLTGHPVPRSVDRATNRPGTPQHTTGPVCDPPIGTSGSVQPDRLDDVLILGRTVADDLRRHQRPLTRASLIQGIRAAGHTIGTDKASALLRQLKATAT